jgi:hypothetical protein
MKSTQKIDKENLVIPYIYHMVTAALQLPVMKNSGVHLISNRYPKQQLLRTSAVISSCVIIFIGTSYCGH